MEYILYTGDNVEEVLRFIRNTGRYIKKYDISPDDNAIRIEHTNGFSRAIPGCYFVVDNLKFKVVNEKNFVKLNKGVAECNTKIQIGNSCIVCGEFSGHTMICKSCKKAILYIRKKLEGKDSE